MAQNDRSDSSAHHALDQRLDTRSAAQRALAEAEARRRQRRPGLDAQPREVNGRQGPEPVRYGDWENKGIASDF